MDQDTAAARRDHADTAALPRAQSTSPPTRSTRWTPAKVEQRAAPGEGWRRRRTSLAIIADPAAADVDAEVLPRDPEVRSELQRRMR